MRCLTLDMLFKVECMEKKRIEEEEGVRKPRKTRRCVVKGYMGYEGPNLKCHLMNVHTKGHIEAADVGKYLTMGLKPKRKRGPKRSLGQGKTTKERCRHWCPERGCNYLGC